MNYGPGVYDPQTYYNIKDAAAFINRSERTLRRWCAADKIKFYRDGRADSGGRLLFDIGDLLKKRQEIEALYPNRA